MIEDGLMEQNRRIMYRRDILTRRYPQYWKVIQAIYEVQQDVLFYNDLEKSIINREIDHGKRN